MLLACSLACLTELSPTSEYASEATEFLKDLIAGKVLVGNIEYKDRKKNVFYLSVGDPETKVHVNQEMVRNGLARPENRKEKHLLPLVNTLRDCEAEARETNVGMWQYGDFDDE
eukprot:TRINITY_DN4035_c0_g2_i1.p1 TRINITY_DN4035_c0_g2~~TRINITY_DN4035_c0_g2_i1.p1  ORF type:complete len:114 (-),score=14.43 TRINITY_DN4035_c0_g2_i1:89-430(-)